MCYLAGEFINELRRNQPELGITDSDVLCIQVAALCFNLGHGPFSFLFQDLFRPQVAEEKEKNDLIVSEMEIDYKLLTFLRQ